MSPEAEVTVRLHRSQGRVKDVTVSSSRRALPRQLFSDRAPDDVSRLVSQLFSVCRKAQSAASTGALEAAQGHRASPETADRRVLEVTLEALQESLWRLLIDWPESMSEAPLVAAVRQARDALAGIERGVTPIDAGLVELDRIAGQYVFGEPPTQWLEHDLAAVDRWIAEARTLPARLLRRLRSETPDLGRSDTPLLPSATLARLQHSVLPYLLRDAGYATAPHWDGTPAETGAIARCAAEPMIAAWIARDGVGCEARFLARLVEHAKLIEALRTPELADLPGVRQHALSPGQGIGLAETARGLLLHHAAVDSGRVVDYAIVAPTEWNFHAQGPIRALLNAAPASDEALLTQARIVVRSLDPCVTSRIEMADA
jgi:uptake hydrogenase large subunit